MTVHPIKPVFDSHSKILILGSFPSVKSRETGFYYGHKQNRFWRVLSAVYKEQVPINTDGKRDFLLSHGIALWDVIASCDIEGYADSSIRNVTVNDIDFILNTSDIQRIITNGGTAHKLYCKYLLPKTSVQDICLPSTSPANASWSLERLTNEWAYALKLSE